MAFLDDAALLRDHAKLYSRGQTLSLTPYRPPKPWGLDYYPMPPDFDEDTGQFEEDKKLTRFGPFDSDKYSSYIFKPSVPTVM
ncbi:hypothetical protein ColTof4_09200 [Colletotrichum tofieldiae]|nr:hypothetical protein ColTof3_03590 [Colletotrichum tofieldiae]GKT76777.1 hypothetical protein ColTof4_09200 [Colletotrichum tofieldiae]GKT97435.1 hypothetical protein Ct61P_15285 [Colletotrichum tofieldiae]